MGDQALNLKFVEEVEKHPELYNFRLKGYSKKDVTEKAWNEVANEVQLTVSECKEKWKNLRSVFVRHLKPQPIDSKGKVRKPYYLYEAMKFTLPFIKTQYLLVENLSEEFSHRCEPKIEPNFSQITQEQAEDDEEINAEEIVEALLPPSPHHLSPASQTIRNQEMTQDFFIQKQQTLKRKKMITYADFVNSDTKELTETSNSFSEGKKLFLLSLLPEIEPMTDAQMKSFRRRVLHLIDDIMNPTDVYQNLPPYHQTSTYTPSSSTSSI